MTQPTAIDSRFTTVTVDGRTLPDHRIVIFPESDGSWLAALYQRNQTAAMATLVPDASTTECLMRGSLATRDGWWVISAEDGAEWCWTVAPPTPPRGGG